MVEELKRKLRINNFFRKADRITSVDEAIAIAMDTPSANYAEVDLTKFSLAVAGSIEISDFMVLFPLVSPLMLSFNILLASIPQHLPVLCLAGTPIQR